MAKPLAWSLIIIAFLLGTAFGFAFTPEYTALGKSLHMSQDGLPDQYEDYRFLSNLLKEQQQSLDLLQQEQSLTKRQEILEFANKEIVNLSQQIKQSYDWKKAWYKDTKKEITTKLNLGKEDSNADLRFLNAQIQQSEKIQGLAQAVQASSSRNEILTLAAQLVQKTSDNIQQFKAWRMNWYGVM